MNRQGAVGEKFFKSVPRTRGDEPMMGKEGKQVNVRSPHTRG